MAKSKLSRSRGILKPGQAAPKSGRYARLSLSGRCSGIVHVMKNHPLPPGRHGLTYQWIVNRRIKAVRYFEITEASEIQRIIKEAVEEALRNHQASTPTTPVAISPREGEGVLMELPPPSGPVPRSSDEFAQQTARNHAIVEPGIVRTFRIVSDREEAASDSVILLEVNRETIEAGIIPLRFRADPGRGIPYSCTIVEVTPEEFARIERGELPLPTGWRFGPEIDISSPESEG